MNQVGRGSLTARSEQAQVAASKNDRSAELARSQRSRYSLKNRSWSRFNECPRQSSDLSFWKRGVGKRKSVHSHLKLRFDGKGTTLREGVSRRSGKRIYAAGMLWGRLAICAKTETGEKSPLTHEQRSGIDEAGPLAESADAEMACNRPRDRVRCSTVPL
jgi:hypothetical protein